MCLYNNVYIYNIRLFSQEASTLQIPALRSQFEKQTKGNNINTLDNDGDYCLSKAYLLPHDMSHALQVSFQSILTINQ